MESLLNELLMMIDSSPVKLILGILVITVYAFFGWFFISRRKQFSESLYDSLRSFSRVLPDIFDLMSNVIIYKEGRSPSSVRHERRLLDLNDRIDEIEKSIKSKDINDKIPEIEIEIKNYIENNYKRISEERLNELKSVEGGITDEIEQFVNNSVINYLETNNIEEIVKHKEKLEYLKRKNMHEEQLSYVADGQLTNSARLKTVMINLFIFFNLGILLFYIFGDVSSIQDKALYSITALYVSLATFIFYIYRVSNSRTSVIMSIHEDSKKYHDVLHFINDIKNGAELSEQDIELIKLLLTNRSEREKSIAHPYEMIFKGVENSNIQFRGGKISFDKKASSNKGA